MTLSKAQRQILAALNEPGHTYTGGFDLGDVFELERLGLLASKPDRLFPSFLAYHITDEGRAALKEPPHAE